LTFVQYVWYHPFQAMTEVWMRRIRELRAERGLTQVRLAVAADMNPATLNRIEQGKANPNIKTLERLASALGVGLVELLEDDSKKAQAPLWSDEAAGTRAAALLRAWRAFIWDLVLRWEKPGNEPTPGQVGDVHAALERLIGSGAFEHPADSVTTADWGEASEWFEVSMLFRGIERLRALAEKAASDEEAARLRNTFEVIDGYRSKAVGE
jgi:transcriptional regulator with XRE-family HTH domain